MVDQTYQALQGRIHLTFVLVVLFEATANLLTWNVADKIARATWIVLCIVCATWHIVGWLEHRSAARAASAGAGKAESEPEGTGNNKENA